MISISVVPAEVLLHGREIVPMVTWGTNPEQVVAITDVVPDPARATNGFRLGGPDWIKMQHALTNISHRSRFIVADTTEHDIQFHRPDQIVAAVREQVAWLNSQPSASTRP